MNRLFVTYRSHRSGRRAQNLNSLSSNVTVRLLNDFLAPYLSDTRHYIFAGHVLLSITSRKLRLATFPSIMPPWRRLFRSAEATDLENRMYELFLADVGHIVEGIFEWWPSPYNPDSPQGTSFQHTIEKIVCSPRKYAHSAGRNQCRETWMPAFVYIVGWDHHTPTSLTVSADWQM